jgi:hypothetical protein
MIKSLSPYYIEIPLISPLSDTVCISYTLEVFVWNGLKTSPPTTPTYSITKKNIDNSVGTDKVNIARIVNDYIDFTPQLGTVTGLYDGNNQRWVKTQVVYQVVDLPESEPVQLVTTVLMLRGYGYGMGGQNQQPPTNKILLQGTEFKVQRNGFFNLPIIIDMTLLERVEILEAEAEATALITAVFIPDGAMIAWNKPANTIPTGWAEVVDFRGKTLVGKDTSGFFGTLGADVGSADAIIPAHTHGQRTSSSNGFDLPQITISGGGSVTGVAGDTSSAGTRTQVLTDSTGESATNKNVQPSRIVHFIEYVGV